jgi:hypothetical protein
MGCYEKARIVRQGQAPEAGGGRMHTPTNIWIGIDVSKVQVDVMVFNKLIW